MNFKLLFASLFILTIGCTPQPKEQEPAEHWYQDAAWSPDGRYILAGGNADTLRLFDAESYQEIEKFAFPGTVSKIEWHPDSRRAAIAMQGGKSPSMLFYPKTGESIPLDSIAVSGACAIGWNHDGSMLAVGDSKGLLNFYTSDGTLLQQRPSGQDTITALDWHTKQNFMVMVGNHITFYDGELDTLEQYPNNDDYQLLLSVDWKPSSWSFNTGDWNNKADDHLPDEYNLPTGWSLPAKYNKVRWYMSWGEEYHWLAEVKTSFYNMRWSPDGKVLALATDSYGLGLLTVNDGFPAVQKNQTASIPAFGVSWNPDGKRLVTTSRDGSITIWNRDLTKVQDLQF